MIKSDTSIIKRLKKKLVKFQALADKIWITETARDTSTDWTSLKERIGLIQLLSLVKQVQLNHVYKKIT